MERLHSDGHSRKGVGFFWTVFIWLRMYFSGGPLYKWWRDYGLRHSTNLLWCNFWDFGQGKWVDCCETASRFNLQSSRCLLTSEPLKTGPKRYLEAKVTNHQLTLCNLLQFRGPPSLNSIKGEACCLAEREIGLSRMVLRHRFAWW
jgi:hypothetical protein